MARWYLRTLCMVVCLCITPLRPVQFFSDIVLPTVQWGGASTAGAATLIWLYADQKIQKFTLQKEYLEKTLYDTGQDKSLRDFYLANLEKEIAQWREYKRYASRVAWGAGTTSAAGFGVQYAGKKRKWWLSGDDGRVSKRRRRDSQTSLARPSRPKPPRPRPSSPVPSVPPPVTHKLGDVLSELKGLVAASDRPQEDISFNAAWRKNDLGKKLIVLGDRREESTPDGGCWFHTLARHLPVEVLVDRGLIPNIKGGRDKFFQLYPLNDDSNTQLRKKIVELVVKKAFADPSGVLMSEIIADYGDIDSYKKEMNGLTEWARDTEVTQGVLFAERPLAVWKSKRIKGVEYTYLYEVKGIRFATGEFADPQNWMHALYSGAHYDIFVPSTEA